MLTCPVNEEGSAPVYDYEFRLMSLIRVHLNKYLEQLALSVAVVILEFRSYFGQFYLSEVKIQGLRD